MTQGVETKKATAFDRIVAAEAVADRRVREEEEKLEHAFSEEKAHQNQRVKSAREALEKKAAEEVAVVRKECQELVTAGIADASREAEQWKTEAEKRKPEAVRNVVEAFLALKEV